MRLRCSQCCRGGSLLGCFMTLTVPNLELSRQTTDWKTHINAGTTIHLYKTSVTIDPTVTIATFTEATYAGYSSQSETCTGPTKIKDGEYELLGLNHVFNAPTSGSQTIYGWWTDDGTNVTAAEAFSSPITMTAGAPGFQLQVAYDHWNSLQYP